MTKLLTCTCVHDYQDKKYNFKKIHNSCGREGKRFRCTVCGKEKDLSAEKSVVTTDTKKK